MYVFGHQIRHFLPVLPEKYRPHSSWRNTLEAREEALRHCHIRAHKCLSEHTRRLPTLKVGDHVRIQNQTGPHPLKWDKTGIIVEVRQYNQYLVKTDGSNRTTLRNRKFLRKFLPVHATQPPRSILGDLPPIQKPSQAVTLQPPAAPTTSYTPPQVMTPGPVTADTGTCLPASLSSNQNSDQSSATPDAIIPSTPKEVQRPAASPSPRRSTRIKRPPGYLSEYVR